MIKNFALALLALLWTSTAFAQQSTMQRFIDQEQVVFVVNMHPGMTYNKLNKETKDKYKINELIAPMLIQFAGGEATEERVKKVAEQLSDPTKAGINVREDVYMWGQRPTSNSEELYKPSDMNAMMINVIMPITDSKKFKIFLDGMMSDQRQKEIIIAGLTLRYSATKWSLLGIASVLFYQEQPYLTISLKTARSSTPAATKPCSSTLWI